MEPQMSRREMLGWVGAKALVTAGLAEIALGGESTSHRLEPNEWQNIGEFKVAGARMVVEDEILGKGRYRFDDRAMSELVDMIAASRGSLDKWQSFKKGGRLGIWMQDDTFSIEPASGRYVPRNKHGAGGFMVLSPETLTGWRKEGDGKSDSERILVHETIHLMQDVEGRIKPTLQDRIIGITLTSGGYVAGDTSMSLLNQSLERRHVLGMITGILGGKIILGSNVGFSNSIEREAYYLDDEYMKNGTIKRLAGDVFSWENIE